MHLQYASKRKVLKYYSGQVTPKVLSEILICGCSSKNTVLPILENEKTIHVRFPLGTISYPALAYFNRVDCSSYTSVMHSSNVHQR